MNTNKDNLLVFHFDGTVEWKNRYSEMLGAGIKEVHLIHSEATLVKPLRVLHYLELSFKIES